MRKTLMLNAATHARIQALADRHNVTQPDVIDALLESAETSVLDRRISDVAALRRVEKERIRERKRKLDALIGRMSDAELTRLLDTVEQEGAHELREGQA